MVSHTTNRILVTTALIVCAVVFVSLRVSANNGGVQRGEFIDLDLPLDVQGTYLSPELTTEFPADIIGAGWRGDAIHEISLRFFSDGAWTEWYQPESLDTVERDGWQYITEPVVADQATRLQYRVMSNGPVRAMRLIYLQDSADSSWVGLRIFGQLLSSASAQETLPITPRAGWSADESYRFYKDGSPVWPATYQQPEKFVIHHTAGDDGGSNPAATIRGIYYWHAVVLGWGDIGYNYIIDQQGTIYEGRAGGDGVVGAHVYRSATCAAQRFGGANNEMGFNSGTIGIAVLGDYETKLSSVNSAVKNAVASLIARKGADFEIDPQGTSYFNDGTYPNVIGHGDVDCTECPGKSLSATLPAIRTDARIRYVALGGSANPTVKAAFVGSSEQPVKVAAGGVQEVWVDFRNDGNVTWRNYTRSPIAVVARTSSSSFYVAAWQSPTTVARLATPNVAPGEVGRFVFTIKGPTNAFEVTESFELAIGDASVSATTFQITAQVSGLPRAASLQSHTVRPATFPSAAQTVTLQFKNRGTETWQRNDVKLNVYDLGDRTSRFRDASWASAAGQIAFREASVPPEETATFTVKLKSPAQVGAFLNVFRLAGTKPVAQADVALITRVDSTYQGAMTQQTVPLAVRTVWRPTVTVKVKNTGLSTWDRNVMLEVRDIDGRASRFHDSSWVSGTAAARLQERSVKPGQVGTFTFRWHGASEAGLFRNVFRLTRSGGLVQGSEFTLVTRVDP